MNILLQVSSGTISASRDEEVTRALMAELDEVPKSAVTVASAGLAPQGSKALDAGVAGLIVSLGAAGATIPTLITTIRDWLLRQPPTTTLRMRRGDFEFEWTGSTPPEQVNSLLNSMIDREV